MMLPRSGRPWLALVSVSYFLFVCSFLPMIHALGSNTNANLTVIVAPTLTQNLTSFTHASLPSFALPSLTAVPTGSVLSSASQLLASATAAIGEANVKLRQNPRRNKYYNKPKRRGVIQESGPLVVDSAVRKAAAIVAEAEAAAAAINGTALPNYAIPGGFAAPPGFDPQGQRVISKRDSGFWMETVGANFPGSDPFGSDSNYVVWRNVMDYGAHGDGVHDDTKAINDAISSGNRCGGGTCDTTSVKPAVVYFPAGTYLVSSSIVAYFNTQLIGNANSLPTIKAAPGFAGLGVISSDVYDGSDGGQGEWYLDTANFYRAVRNFIVDIRSVNTNGVACIHWQVAQATSLENVWMFMTPDSTKAQVGIFSENGSGGFMADLYFVEGSIGLQCGNQQFTTRNLNFYYCTTGVSLLWDWGWTFKSIHIYSAYIGVNITAGNDPGGSVYLLDSFMKDTPIGVAMNDLQNWVKTNYVNIQNLNYDNVHSVVSVGSAVLVPGDSGTDTLDSWVYGMTYNSDSQEGSGRLYFGAVENLDSANNPLGTDGGPTYFERSRPQYTSETASNFVNVKDYASGNGKHDDTEALNDMIAYAASRGYILYIPAGVYIVTDTIYVPPGSRIVGSCWSQIMASGSKFQNQASPHPMIQIGRPGDVGTVEVQDLLFTVQGATAGAVLVEWNMKASSPGAAALWDCHYRVGGALGTSLSASNCPALTGKINWNCVASSLMLHLTDTSSAYIENSWAWVADHDLDSQALTQIDIYSARGVLIESKGPTWLYATASEHSLLYQYQLNNATNIFMGMIQTESPYYSPSPDAPGPFGFQIGYFDADPNFVADFCAYDHSPGCAAAWALSIVNSSNVTVGGAGLYSWFVDYDESCVDKQNCQESLVNTDSNQDIFIRNLYTIGATNMIVPQNSIMDVVYAANNTNEESHPYLAVVAAWTDTNGDQLSLPCDWNDTRPICNSIADYCDPNLKFDSLAALNASAPSLPSWCLQGYATQVVYDMLGAAVNNYSTVDNGYDSVWGDYVQVVQQQVNTTLTSYMNLGSVNAPGNKWFDCVFEDISTGQKSPSQPCPPSASDLEKRAYRVFYTIKPGLEANLTADLLDNYGIEPDWWYNGNWTDAWQGNNNCPPSKNCPTSFEYHYYGVPLEVSNIVVPNPKDLVDKILPNVTVVQDTIYATRFNIINGLWVGSNDDVLQATTTAVFLFVQAVENMAQAKAIGQQQYKKDHENFITTILTIVFSVLPFLGEAIEIVEPLAQIGRIIALFGVAGSDALSIKGIVDNPLSAPFEILGILTAGAAARDPEDFARMGAARRAMTSDQIVKCGETFADLSAQVKSIVKACER